MLLFANNNKFCLIVSRASERERIVVMFVMKCLSNIDSVHYIEGEHKKSGEWKKAHERIRDIFAQEFLLDTQLKYRTRLQTHKIFKGKHIVWLWWRLCHHQIETCTQTNGNGVHDLCVCAHEARIRTRISAIVSFQQNNIGENYVNLCKAAKSNANFETNHGVYSSP